MPLPVLTVPLIEGSYIEWVLIYQVWCEKNSATIDAWVCRWLNVCKTSVQPDWMRKRDVQALDLSPGFSDRDLKSQIKGGKVICQNLN